MVTVMIAPLTQARDRGHHRPGGRRRSRFRKKPTFGIRADAAKT